MFRTIIFIIIGLTLMAVPSILWYKKYGNKAIEIHLLPIRKKYRTWGSLGLMVVLVSIIRLSELLDPEFSPIALYLVIPLMAMSNNRIFFEPYYTSDVVDGLDDICLYLRSFSLNANDPGYFIKGKTGIPESLERILGNIINEKVAKLYCIGDPNAALPTTESASCIYASDVEWKTSVSKLTEKSKLIFLRIMKTEGCIWEMRHCLATYLSKTIFLIDSTEHFNLLQEYIKEINIEIPNAFINSKSCQAFFYDNQTDQWHMTELKSMKDIHSMIGDYSNLHCEFKDEISQKHDIRNILKKPFNNVKTPDRWIHWPVIILQPLWYVWYNRWPKIWKTLFIIYILLVICLLDTLPILLTAASIIFWLWLAPRITMAHNAWGSTSIARESNKALCKWMLVYAALAILI